MLKDFRDFALRGNVLDLAVGIIIGAAFTTIVTSMVEDIIMPPIGMILGQVDFSSLYINLSGQQVTSVALAKEAGVPVIAYGLFINAVIKFLIVAFSLFLIIRAMTRLKAKLEREKADAAATATEPPRQEVLLEQIRDLLAKDKTG